MQLGLLISVILHVAILGGAVISIQSRPELRVAEPEPVAVGMISPSELTQVRRGIRTAKLLEADAKESPKGDTGRKEVPRPTKTAATAPPPPPPPPPEPPSEPPRAAEPPPPSAAAIEAQKQLAAEQKERERQAAEQKQAEAERLAEEQKRAEAQKQAEAQKLAEEQRQAEAQRLAEEKKRAEEQKHAEERKRAEEERQRLEEQRRQAELKKKREAAKKKREAALKRKREAEKKRQEEERRRQAEAAKKKAKTFEELMAEEKALLNKDPRAKSAPPPSTAAEQPTKAKGPTLGDREGRDTQISATERAMLNGIIGARLRSCWRLTSAGGGSDTPVVTLRWHLRPDGSLDGDPLVVERTRSDTLFDLAAEAAIRAVRECSPFPLPPEKYNAWKTITRDFDPASMLR